MYALKNNVYLFFKNTKLCIKFSSVLILSLDVLSLRVGIVEVCSSRSFIPLCDYTTTYLFISLLMKIQVVSPSIPPFLSSFLPFSLSLPSSLPFFPFTNSAAINMLKNMFWCTFAHFFSIHVC